MDKPRHPHVIRTWVVNKMRTPLRHDQPVQPVPHNREVPARGGKKPVPGTPPRTHE